MLHILNACMCVCAHIAFYTNDISATFSISTINDIPLKVRLQGCLVLAGTIYSKPALQEHQLCTTLVHSAISTRFVHINYTVYVSLYVFTVLVMTAKP